MAPRKQRKPSRKTSAVIEPKPERWSYKDSVFWRQIVAADNAALTLAVGDMVEGARSLAKLVIKELPLFTLHDETHLDNVLYWMEQLITEDGLEELGPVGCAVCLLIAYTHDLGMVPEPDWKKRLENPDDQEAVKFRGWATVRHADLLELAERCRAAGDGDAAQRKRAEWIEGYLRTDYLRDTHADEGHTARVKSHLQRLAAAAKLTHPFDFLGDAEKSIELLTAMAASHNRRVHWWTDWLEKRAKREGGAESEKFWRVHVAAGTPNLLLPALLLRVADVCDFDRSRTPSILFQQIGLEGFDPLGLPPEQTTATGISVREWGKHLAVDRWEWTGPGGGRLTYVAAHCRHPAVERSIRGFCGTIRDEIAGVKAELARVLRGADAMWLRLPDEVVPSIAPCASYVYHDVQFQLQAHEVTQLLMGTALYGNPELCVRELLQNALDAVQLRDLRCQLRDKFEAPDYRGEPAPDWLEPAERWKGDERETPIRLEWGVETVDGQEKSWIAVRDAGTGMTLDQITRYLSALGRSYYKSAEFGAEARLMREHGLIATPISQFGIGILSCFMVAESIEVRTCPCGADADRRKPWHVKITGPGSLFHFAAWNAGTSDSIRPGTEVKLWLKRGFKLTEPKKREIVIAYLRRRLGYDPARKKVAELAVEKDGVRWFYPGVVAAEHVIWPRYPILAHPVARLDLDLRLHGRWHFDELYALNERRLKKAARAWGCQAMRVTGVHWHCWDWIDDDPQLGTGSRMRVVFPVVGGDAKESRLDRIMSDGRVRPGELGVWAEQQIEGSEVGRQRYLVRGMTVHELHRTAETLVRAAAGVGAFLWIDFVGETAPGLTADRKIALVPDGKLSVRWRGAVDSMFERWLRCVAAELAPGSRARAEWRLLVHLDREGREFLAVRGSRAGWSLTKAVDLSWRPKINASSAAAAFAASSLAAEYRRDDGRQDAEVDAINDGQDFRKLGSDLYADAYIIAPDVAWALGRHHHGHIGFIRSDDFGRRHNENYVYFGTHSALGEALGCSGREDLFRRPTGSRNYGEPVLAAIECYLLNAAVWPSIPEGFPGLRMPHSVKAPKRLRLVSPTRMEALTAMVDGRDFLERYGFDFSMPLSVFHSAAWGQKCPDWMSGDGWWSLLVCPFLAADAALARRIAKALCEPPSGESSWLSRPRRERTRALRKQAREIAQHTLHVLIPRSGLWEKPFVDWTTDDRRVAGYSAQWNLTTGEMLWAVGVVPRDEMMTRGVALERFLDSDQMKDFRQECPALFPANSARK